MAFIKFEDIIQKLHERFNKPLPGDYAHKLLEPSYRNQLPATPGPDCRESAVLILLYPTEHSQILFPLTLRQQHLGIHSNQISLPGGKKEQRDPNLLQTALREAYEEIGVNPDQIKIIGKMTPLFIPPSKFMVHPYIGYLPRKPHLKHQQSEVAEIYEADPFRLLRDDNIICTAHLFKDKEYEVKVYKIADRSVWGATGMILSELKMLLNIS